MTRYELEYYGVPVGYQEHFEACCRNPEILKKYQQILQENLRPRDVIAKYAKEGYLGYVVVLAAIEMNLSFLIPLAYSLSLDDRKHVYCDWIIEHPEIDLTASNAFFVSYFNELYYSKPDIMGRYLSSKGVALRALAYLSYLPWVNFHLPVTDTIVSHFLYLPLCDREKNVLDMNNNVA